MIAIHKPSDFKSSPEKILDAAKTAPQYVVDNGALLVLQRVDKLPSESVLKGKSVAEVLASGRGLGVSFPKMTDQVRKVTL